MAECRPTMRFAMHRWFSHRALLLHLEFFLIVAACAVATAWQARRALGGNDLSWFYTFEWPILAGIAIAAWWHLIHENPQEREARKRERVEKDPAEPRPSGRRPPMAISGVPGPVGSFLGPAGLPTATVEPEQRSIA